MSHFPKLIPAGFEQTNVTACNPKGLQNQPKTGGALSGALSDDSAPNLAKLTDMLSSLSDADKKIIAAGLAGMDEAM